MPAARPIINGPRVSTRGSGKKGKSASHRRFLLKIEANRIKTVLIDQGRSQTWLAEKLGKSYVVVTNYCNNNSQPSIEVLRRIAEILDIDVRELLVGTK